MLANGLPTATGPVFQTLRYGKDGLTSASDSEMYVIHTTSVQSG
jgi:hypothetical protein